MSVLKWQLSVLLLVSGAVLAAEPKPCSSSLVLEGKTRLRAVESLKKDLLKDEKAQAQIGSSDLARVDTAFTNFQDMWLELYGDTRLSGANCQHLTASNESMTRLREKLEQLRAQSQLEGDTLEDSEKIELAVTDFLRLQSSIFSDLRSANGNSRWMCTARADRSAMGTNLTYRSSESRHEIESKAREVCNKTRSGATTQGSSTLDEKTCWVECRLEI